MSSIGSEVVNRFFFFFRFDTASRSTETKLVFQFSLLRLFLHSQNYQFEQKKLEATHQNY